MPRHTAQTSIESYYELAEQGKLAPQCQKVYDCLRTHGPISIRDIHDRIGMEIGTVCGRLGDLKDYNIVRKTHLTERDSKTGKRVQLWVINHVEKIAFSEIKTIFSKTNSAQVNLFGGTHAVV